MRDGVHQRIKALDHRDRREKGCTSSTEGSMRRRAFGRARDDDRNVLLVQLVTRSLTPLRVSSRWLRTRIGKWSPASVQGPCISSAALIASAWMPEVSFSFSAASCATAKPTPRPTTKRLSASDRSGSAADQSVAAAFELVRQAVERDRGDPVLRPVGDELQPGCERRDEGFGRRDALLRSRMKRQNDFAGRGERRGGVVDERDRQRPVVAPRFRQMEDVGAAAGLRDGEESASRMRGRAA